MGMEVGRAPGEESWGLRWGGLGVEVGRAGEIKSRDTEKTTSRQTEDTKSKEAKETESLDAKKTKSDEPEKTNSQKS